MFKQRKTARVGALRPDRELWSAMGSGEFLKVILADFYDHVFEDEKLVRFFDGVTKEYVAQKQYGFMRSILTGEACYFGAQPRNAHHWMVISDDLFDHRERLMEECLHRHGVDQKVIDRVREIDEVYRKQIVKEEPRILRICGIDVPLDGLEQIEVSVAYVCDRCSEPLEVGMSAFFSVRSSETYCLPCGGDSVPSLLPNSEEGSPTLDSQT